LCLDCIFCSFNYTNKLSCFPSLYRQCVMFSWRE